MGAHRRSERPRSQATYGPETGTTYLLHFDRPYGHARHYVGWTQDLAARLEAHARGRGARLVQVVVEAGIGFRLARTWPESTRDREDLIKHAGGARRYCPECGVKPRDQATPQVPARDRRPMWMADRDGQWNDGTPIIYDPGQTWQEARAIRAALQIPEPDAASKAELAALDEVQRQWTSQEEHVNLKDTAARLGAAIRSHRDAHQREASAEADRLWALADELDKQMGRRPGYQHELTAERAARIRALIGEDLARDAHLEAMPRAEGKPLEHWAITPEDVADAAQSARARREHQPGLQGAGLDAEISRLAEEFPEPEDPGPGGQPDHTPAGPRPAPAAEPGDWEGWAPTEPPKVLGYPQAWDRLGHLQGAPYSEEITRMVEAGEIEMGPYGPIVTELDRETTLAQQAQQRAREPGHTAQPGRPAATAQSLARDLDEAAVRVGTMRRLEAHALAQEHAARHARASAAATAAREHAQALRQARLQAEADTYQTAAALQAHAAARGGAPSARPSSVSAFPLDVVAEPDGGALVPPGAEPRPDAARWTPHAAAPDQLPGAPEHAQADPPTAHLTDRPGEPEDRRSSPEPRQDRPSSSRFWHEMDPEMHQGQHQADAEDTMRLGQPGGHPGACPAPGGPPAQYQAEAT